MEKQYIHLSKKPISKLLDKNQNKTPGLQPKGLWIAKDKEWIRFMDKNTSRDLNGYVYSVNLNFPVVKKLKEEDNKVILKVGNQKELDKFMGNYMVSNYKIDWKKLSNDCAGIIFEPYFYNKDMDPEKNKWYSTLDISSGCIWNKDAMSINLLHENPAAKLVRFNFRNKNPNLDKLLLS